MENSRPRIELMNSLLFSMPGTPIIYYGDEIGMGDNVYLGDRNGVRTPMQWSSDRNAGFSRADPARLYVPVIMDPVYGYEAINVEAQERSPFSLLHWMKRMIALRKQHPVFGRGSLSSSAPTTARCSSTCAATSTTSSCASPTCRARCSRWRFRWRQFAGLTPVEMLGQTEFPRIGEQPYFLTLAPYGFYWFQLQEVVVPITARTAPVPEEHAALPVALRRRRLGLDARRRHAHRSSSGRRSCRSCSGSAGSAARRGPLASARFVDWATLRRGAHPAFLTIVEAEYRDGGRERYVLPLAMSSGAEADGARARHARPPCSRASPARARACSTTGCSTTGRARCCWRRCADRQDARDAARQPARIASRCGDRLGAGRRPDADRASAPDQSNTSVLFGKRIIMKLFRRLEPGLNPDIEIGEFLAPRGFTPRAAAARHCHTCATPTSRPRSPCCSGYVYNQGNGWQVTIEELGRYFERTLALTSPTVSHADARAWAFGQGAPPPPEVAEAIGVYLMTAEVLGRRTGELHVQLAEAATEDAAFALEAMTAERPALADAGDAGPCGRAAGPAGVVARSPRRSPARAREPRARPARRSAASVR